MLAKTVSRFGYLLTAVTMASAVLPAAAQTVQTNDLFMTMGSGISNASYAANESNFEVSSGQPKGIPPALSSFTPSNSLLNFIVYAGRHGTSAVADTFNSGTVARVATRRANSTGGPDDLNFTFSGTLTLNNDQFSNFYIGQGSTGIHNNWWIGVVAGNTAANSDNAFLCITGSTGTRYQITLPEDDSFHLNVTILSAGTACGG